MYESKYNPIDLIASTLQSSTSDSKKKFGNEERAKLNRTADELRVLLLAEQKTRKKTEMKGEAEDRTNVTEAIINFVKAQICAGDLTEGLSLILIKLSDALRIMHEEKGIALKTVIEKALLFQQERKGWVRNSWLGFACLVGWTPWIVLIILVPNIATILVVLIFFIMLLSALVIVGIFSDIEPLIVDYFYKNKFNDSLFQQIEKLKENPEAAHVSLMEDETAEVKTSVVLEEKDNPELLSILTLLGGPSSQTGDKKPVIQTRPEFLKEMRGRYAKKEETDSYNSPSVPIPTSDL